MYWNVLLPLLCVTQIQVREYDNASHIFIWSLSTADVTRVRKYTRSCSFSYTTRCTHTQSKPCTQGVEYKCGQLLKSPDFEACQCLAAAWSEKTAIVKLLCHAILVLGEGCNTLLISANSSKACFDTLRSSLDMPQNLASSIIDHTYILHVQGLLCICVHLVV